MQKSRIEQKETVDVNCLLLIEGGISREFSWKMNEQKREKYVDIALPTSCSKQKIPAMSKKNLPFVTGSRSA